MFGARIGLYSNAVRARTRMGARATIRIIVEVRVRVRGKLRVRVSVLCGHRPSLGLG